MNRGATAPKRKKFRVPVFYVCLIFAVVLALVAMAFGLKWLEGWLAEYESSQPKYAAEAVFAEYFADPDYPALAARCEMPATVSVYETGESLGVVMEELYGEQPTSYAETSSGMDGSLRYLVKAGESKIASFTLKKSGKTAKHGFSLYALDDITLYIRPEADVKVTAPEGMTVYINGQPLDESHVVESGIETDSCAHMPEGVKGITYATYTLNALLRAPSVEVKTADGQSAPLTQDPDTGAWMADVVYHDALREQYAEQMIHVAQLYAAYVQKDGTFGSFSKYFDSSTTLYQNIREVPNYFVWAHNGYSFKDVEASEFYAYDDNTFSCRIKFTHLLHKTGYEDFVDAFDSTFYLRRVGDEFLIYSMINNLGGQA